jgi:hypothetical protein
MKKNLTNPLDKLWYDMTPQKIWFNEKLHGH